MIYDDTSNGILSAITNKTSEGILLTMTYHQMTLFQKMTTRQITFSKLWQLFLAFNK